MKKIGMLIGLILTMFLLFNAAIWLDLKDIESVKHFILSFGAIAPIIYYSDVYTRTTDFVSRCHTCNCIRCYFRTFFGALSTP